MSDFVAATGAEAAVAAFSPLLDVLADVPDPRRAQGQFCKLPLCCYSLSLPS